MEVVVASFCGGCVFEDTDDDDDDDDDDDCRLRWRRMNPSLCCCEVTYSDCFCRVMMVRCSNDEVRIERIEEGDELLRNGVEEEAIVTNIIQIGTTRTTQQCICLRCNAGGLVIGLIPEVRCTYWFVDGNIGCMDEGGVLL
jgi:hypothetical protein